jgi:hypothetical protein
MAASRVRRLRKATRKLSETFGSDNCDATSSDDDGRELWGAQTAVSAQLVCELGQDDATRRLDQRQVRGRLREVPEMAAGAHIELLGE